MDHKRRIEALRKRLADLSLDAILVTHEANVAYLSGFEGHDSSLLVTGKEALFITDSRYVEEANDALGGLFRVELASNSAFESIVSITHRERVRRLGFEGMRLAYTVAMRLKKYMGATGLIDTNGCVEGIRAIKDTDEIAAIRRSVDLTNRIFKKTAAIIRPGVSEEAVARNIELDFLHNGARQSFSTIVASGVNSSKPHARPGSLRLKKNSFVMIDMGCLLKGYCSDLTRMVVLGKTGARFKKIYLTVRAAQQRAIDLIRPGAIIRDIDRAARGYIEKKGYGGYFGHSLGHGVGLEVHEEPHVSYRNENRLKAGMVFTVEPAIYIPGFGGVRIEDMVLVTKKGCEILTR